MRVQRFISRLLLGVQTLLLLHAAVPHVHGYAQGRARGDAATTGLTWRRPTRRAIRGGVG